MKREGEEFRAITRSPSQAMERETPCADGIRLDGCSSFGIPPTRLPPQPKLLADDSLRSAPQVEPCLSWPSKIELLGVSISVTDYTEAVRLICHHARRALGGAIGTIPIHGVMLGTRDKGFGRCINDLEMATPDGQGVRWAMNLLHDTRLDDRVYGPELTLRVSAEAARQGLGVYLFGSVPAVAEGMRHELEKRYPGLRIVGVECPAEWPWPEEIDDGYVSRIRRSGAQIVFVGLGCPRQERWIHKHRNQLSAVLVSVGAAFDFISGAKRQAPNWVQNWGLEMVFRTIQEPRRLWSRLVHHSPAFVMKILMRWLKTGPRRALPAGKESRIC